MEKIIYLDCGMGLAGDMLNAALYELLEDEEKKYFLEKINELNVYGIEVLASKEKKMGILGCHYKVTISGKEEESLDSNRQANIDAGHLDNDHEDENTYIENHNHIHEEHHNHGQDSKTHHRKLKDIIEIISDLSLSKKIKEDAINIYKDIAKAESQVHGRSVEEIHFHEVGALDAIADIVGVCILVNILNPTKIISSPIATGYGYVKCAHGTLPVPAPATAILLKESISYMGDIEGELCTPTGAALISYFANEFKTMPPMQIEKTGYGFGKKDFAKLNAVRAILGYAEKEKEKIAILECNVDDMTGEAAAFAMETLLEKGARDVFIIPINMKKARPGMLISCICDLEDREKFAKYIFEYTSTIGIRMHICDRYTLDRYEIKKNTLAGEISYKISRGFGVEREKSEYEDIVKYAKDEKISIDEARKRLK